MPRVSILHLILFLLTMLIIHLFSLMKKIATLWLTSINTWVSHPHRRPICLLQSRGSSIGQLHSYPSLCTQELWRVLHLKWFYKMKRITTCGMCSLYFSIWHLQGWLVCPSNSILFVAVSCASRFKYLWELIVQQSFFFSIWLFVEALLNSGTTRYMLSLALRVQQRRGRSMMAWDEVW